MNLVIAPFRAPGGLFGRLLAALLLLALALPLSARAADPPKIAFAIDSTADGRASRIFLSNPDGAAAKAVTAGAAHDRAPALSPDGRSLAYQSSNDLGLDTVLVQPLDTAGAMPHVVAVGGNPQWSTDGQRLLFSRRQANEYGIYVIKADGSQKDDGLKPIAKGQIGRWSKGENQLAVVAPAIVDGKDRWQIQVMPAAGAPDPKVRLTLPEAFGQVVSLEWSPDGGSLLFSTIRQNHFDLYVVDLKSPDPRKVPAADNVPNAAYGSWSPDGSEILFRAAADASSAGLSRLCVMKADGTAVRTIWEPDDRNLRIQGTAWQHPPITPVVVLPPVVRQPDPVKPTPAKVPEPPKVNPEPPKPVRVLGPPRKVHNEKLFAIEQPRSPVSVPLTVPGAADFVVSVTALPERGWKPRRQGVGLTLELEDGGLYRGTVIYSGVPWVTLQGRPQGGKVRLIDGKKLPTDVGGFGRGFQLTIRREGPNMIVSVDSQDILSRPVLTSPIKGLSLTLENFDPGTARFNLGGIFYKEWVEQLPGTPGAPGAPAGAPMPTLPTTKSGDAGGK